ncbi:MAG: 50S ribosomal protein L24 [Candidatus Ranarchaeia archaeon]
MTLKTKKPGKQRKMRYTAALHRRRKYLTAHLHPSLQEKYGIKRLPVRVGDTVIVFRGSYRDIEGKVSAVNYSTLRLSIENVTAEKSDGSQYFQPISPSNVLITKLKTDKRRPLKGEIEGD